MEAPTCTIIDLFVEIELGIVEDSTNGREGVEKEIFTTSMWFQQSVFINVASSRRRDANFITTTHRVFATVSRGAVCTARAWLTASVRKTIPSYLAITKNTFVARAFTGVRGQGVSAVIIYGARCRTSSKGPTKLRMNDAENC